MATTEIAPERNGKTREATREASSSAAISAARRYLPYLVFAFCVSLYFLPLMRLLVRCAPEGTMVEGAVRTIHGQLLGRDFFGPMGPGTFYWLALFFKLFGVTFLASRICLFVSSLGTALSIYFLSRRVCRNYQVLPCVLVFATYVCGLWPTISHHVDSNCFALLAVVCMVLWQDSRSNWLLVAAGALTGATTLILQHKGILLLLAFLVWLWIQHRRRSTPLSALVWVTAACLGVVASMLGYFWSRGALGDLIYANVVWPSRYYGPAFSVHYASFIFDNFKNWVAPLHGVNWTVGLASLLVIPFLFVAALPAFVLLLGARDGVKAMRMEIVLYWLTGSALWFSELHRKDIAHLVFGSPLLIILCIFYLQKRQDKGSDLALQALYIVSVSLAAANLIVALVARPMATRVGEVHVSAYDPVLTAIDEHVPAGAEILIYPYSPIYYFLSATSNPTRYSAYSYNFKVGSQFVLDEVIRNLDQHKVKYVLWDKAMEDRIGDLLTPSMPLKRIIIAPYLESRYSTIWTHDGTVLMERNDDRAH